jgi:serine/threonine-protein phosphatase 6 regulatory subunit 3
MFRGLINFLNAYGIGESKIQQILEKEGGCSLEDLLLENEVVMECKNSNQKLLDYLCKPENLQDLIKYTILYPVDPENKNATHR